MPTTLVEELAEVDYVRDQTGEQRTRRFFVTITGESPSDIEGDVVNSGVAPLYGDVHPSNPDISVIRAWFEPRAHRTGIINCRYGKLSGSSEVVSGSQLFSDGRWTGIDATILSEQTTNDRNGTQMVMTYSGFPYPGSIQFTLADQIAEAVVENYLPTFFFERAAFNWPRAHVETFQNKVNSLTWSGFAPKTVLARVRIRERSEGGYGEFWTFIFNPNTWDFEAKFIVQGIIPQDAVLGDGIEMFEIFGEEDFNTIPDAGTPVVVPT